MTEMAGVEAAAPVAYQGCLIIEWPAPRKPAPYNLIPGWQVALTDAVTGAQITTAMRIEIHADASDTVTADVTMFAGEDGQPVYQLEKVQHPETGRWHEKIPAMGEDGRPREGTFRFLVAEMRVRQHAPGRAALEPKFQEPCAS
jgi:hypothetical protein